MSMKKILMLSVMTALIAPIAVSSAIASKTMGQILLEQNQKQEAEKKAEEQKRIAEEQKAVATAKQEEHKQVLATGNVELEKKINTVIDGLNKSMGTHIGQAKADDIKSLEAAVDDILNQIPKVYQAGHTKGHADGVVAGHAQGLADGHAAGNKQLADVLNIHLNNIIPNHKTAVIADDINNFVPVLQAADEFIGQMPNTIFTGVVVEGGQKVDLAGYVEGMRKALVDVAKQSNAKKLAINTELNRYHLEIK